MRLGPGEYQLQGVPRAKAVKFTIPLAEAPREIVHDFHMPRPETGPFAIRVVDADGQPVAGAMVKGRYASAEARRWFKDQLTNPQGVIETERSLDPLVLHASLPDKELAGVARIDSQTTQAEVVVGPLATAHGRLSDLAGRALAAKELRYGIRIYEGPTRRSPFSDNFGGTIATDSEGRFTLVGLVPGETYQLSIQLDERSSRGVKEIKPEAAKTIDLGELRVDPEPSKPYVPPTPDQRTVTAFAASKKAPPERRVQNLLAEARREYTRPLLLFGRPADKACIDLFRLFDEDPPDEAATNQFKPRLPVPSELRWEFELAALDTKHPEVVDFAKEIGIDVKQQSAPVLAMLSDEGRVIATLPLQLQDDKKLDAQAVSRFLVEHKFPQRDAQQMLDDALAQAKEQEKRVFFILSASWCGPCRMLARFVAAEKAELEQHYVFVKLDISRDKHAEALRQRYKESKSGGVPWFAVLDTTGQVLITSNAPAEEAEVENVNSNIGFPSSPEGIEHFLTILKQTAPKMTSEKREQLGHVLAKKP